VSPAPVTSATSRATAGSTLRHPARPATCRARRG
jgi:hypothetical protein